MVRRHTNITRHTTYEGKNKCRKGSSVFRGLFTEISEESFLKSVSRRVTVEL